MGGRHFAGQGWGYTISGLLKNSASVYQDRTLKKSFFSRFTLRARGAKS